jgi:nitrite reductase (NO-forming)
MSRRNFLKSAGLATVGTGLLSACADSKQRSAEAAAAEAAGAETAGTAQAAATVAPTVDRIAADPIAIPGPIQRDAPERVEVTLEVQEAVAEIEPGVTFNYMTFGGQVPGPLIRVRQGDTIVFTLKNLPDNGMTHNVDLHAVYGTGGGNIATNVSPGQANGLIFKAMYPGAFIYHCAVPVLDYHISCGMFGMILVEPPEGLPPVDHEFYLGQHDVYTNQRAGTKGHHAFDAVAMQREDPTYVLLNGEKHALTADRRGAMKVKVGDTARIFFVNGGPNLISSFHPIGNVWSKAWSAGALASTPTRYVQTLLVPPGSCAVTEMTFPVPGSVKLVDHAITRVVSKGMLGVIEVEGEAQPDIFNPDLPGDPTG